MITPSELQKTIETLNRIVNLLEISLVPVIDDLIRKEIERLNEIIVRENEETETNHLN